MTRYEEKRLDQFVAEGPACAVLLAKFLAERRRPKPSFRKAEKKAFKEGAKLARQAARLACEVRAKGQCEVLSLFGSFVPAGRLELDHFYGRAFSESVETCWMLCRECHRMKTENAPSRKHWDDQFALHCNRYGYPFRPRLTKDIQRSGK